MLAKIPPNYLIYWSLACVLLGVLMAPLFYPQSLTWEAVREGATQSPQAQPEDHSMHFNHEHQAGHGMLEVDAQGAPVVSIAVAKDVRFGWNVRVQLSNFEFAPEQVNLDNQDNRGHAHLYINGEKLTRLYAHHYHLAELPPGEYEVAVSLNANDHSTLAVNGEPIMARTLITQP